MNVEMALGDSIFLTSFIVLTISFFGLVAYLSFLNRNPSGK